MTLFILSYVAEGDSREDIAPAAVIHGLFSTRALAEACAIEICTRDRASTLEDAIDEEERDLIQVQLDDEARVPEPGWSKDGPTSYPFTTDSVPGTFQITEHVVDDTTSDSEVLL